MKSGRGTEMHSIFIESIIAISVVVLVVSASVPASANTPSATPTVTSQDTSAYVPLGNIKTGSISVLHVSTNMKDEVQRIIDNANATNLSTVTQVSLPEFNFGKAGKNLLLNSDFEKGLENWNTSEGTAIYSLEDLDPIEGKYCVKGIEMEKGSLGRLYQDVTHKCEPDKAYNISGWIKTDNVNGAIVIALDYVMESGWCPAEGYVKEIGYVSGTTDWEYFESGPFILPPMPDNCVALWCLFDFNAGKGTAWWDNVSLVELEPIDLSYYDVIVFGVNDDGETSGPYDGEYEQTEELKDYVLNGGGIIWTHDTLEWAYDYGPDIEEPAGVDECGADRFHYDAVKIIKDHKILHYPFELGNTGATMDIDYTHTTGGGVTTAEIIMRGEGWADEKKLIRLH